MADEETFMLSDSPTHEHPRAMPLHQGAPHSGARTGLFQGLAWALGSPGISTCSRDCSLGMKGEYPAESIGEDDEEQLLCDGSFPRADALLFHCGCSDVDRACQNR